MGEANRRKAARGEVKDYFVSVFYCPNCGHKLDGMTATKPGSSPHKIPKSHTIICVCIKCHHIFVMEKNKARDLTDEEVVNIAGDPHLVKIMNIAAKVKEIVKRKEKNNDNV